jgi:hypothetical protein
MICMPYMQFADTASKVNKRVTDYLLQQDQKLLYLSPLANYQRGNRAPHANSDKGKQTIFDNFKKVNFGRLSS